MSVPIKSKGKSTATNATRLIETSSDTTKSRLEKKRNTLALNNDTIVENASVSRKITSRAGLTSSLPNFDASCIATSSSFMVPRKNKTDRSTLTSTAIKKPSGNKVTNSTFPPVPLIFKDGKKASKLSTKNTEAALDIYCAEYQLSLLLKNKAERSLMQKSDDAMEKIYQAFCYIKVLLGKHEIIRRGINIVTFLSDVHEHLVKQEKILIPTLEILPSIECKYEEIALAIDSIRHKLKVTDVVLPEAGSEGTIIELVEKISSLLDEILSSVNSCEIVTSAEAATKFTDKGKAIVDEIRRGSELVSEAKDLLLSATTYKLVEAQEKS